MGLSGSGADNKPCMSMAQKRGFWIEMCDGEEEISLEGQLRRFLDRIGRSQCLQLNRVHSSSRIRLDRSRRTDLLALPHCTMHGADRSFVAHRIPDPSGTPTTITGSPPYPLPMQPAEEVRRAAIASPTPDDAHNLLGLSGSRSRPH